MACRPSVVVEPMPETELLVKINDIDLIWCAHGRSPIAGREIFSPASRERHLFDAQRVESIDGRQRMGLPAEMRPRPRWRFDLDAALDSVVQLRRDPETRSPRHPRHRARRQRIVIREDACPHHRYLITEASTIWLTTNQAWWRRFPLAYDQATGFAWCSRSPPGARAIERGTRRPAASARRGVAGHAPRARAEGHRVRQAQFAGYWNTCSTRPLHAPRILNGCAALIGSDGKLLGIGLAPGAGKDRPRTLQATCWCRSTCSSRSSTHAADRPRSPSFASLARHVHTEAGRKLVVAGLAPGGPAERAA